MPSITIVLPEKTYNMLCLVENCLDVEMGDLVVNAVQQELKAAADIGFEEYTGLVFEELGELINSAENIGD
jgi:hypothetical protein